MSKRIRYDELRTLEDVKAARLRVEREIVRVKGALNDDYDRITEVLSVEYWMGVITRKIGNIVTVVKAAANGYGFISSLFKKYSRKSYEEMEVEEEGEEEAPEAEKSVAQPETEIENH